MIFFSERFSFQDSLEVIVNQNLIDFHYREKPCFTRRTPLLVLWSLSIKSPLFSPLFSRGW